MKLGIFGVRLIVCSALVAGCTTPLERTGQALFAGCANRVDDGATLRSGAFVCKGKRDPEPFGGNGRACGDCHRPGDNFGISAQDIARLPDDDPFFFPGLDEDPRLLRSFGLIHVVVPGQIDDFGQTPKLVQLQASCDRQGNCRSLGLLGDRVKNLCVFSGQAIANHMSKTVNRVPGRDFRLPTRDECHALVAYLLSDLVARQDERPH